MYLHFHMDKNTFCIEWSDERRKQRSNEKNDKEDGQDKKNWSDWDAACKKEGCASHARKVNQNTEINEIRKVDEQEDNKIIALIEIIQCSTTCGVHKFKIVQFDIQWLHIQRSRHGSEHIDNIVGFLIIVLNQRSIGLKWEYCVVYCAFVDTSYWIQYMDFPELWGRNNILRM